MHPPIRSFPRVAAAALLLLTAAASRAQESYSPPLFSRLRAVEMKLEARRNELHVPGMALVIVKDGRVIYLKGLGQRDVERDLPVTPDTLFAIGSSTKAFTGLSVLMSVEEGKLSLHDPPRKYLPYFKLRDPEADAKITVSDLLSHRSGLDRTDLLWYTGALGSRDVLKAMADVKPTAKLGEKFQYQNVMFLAAGEIVAKVQEMPWTRFVERRILQPLGMERTNLSVAEMEAEADHSLGYTWNEAEKRAIRLPMRDLPSVAPAGAINSSAREMGQWLRFLLARGEIDGKRLISEKGFQELGVERIKMTPSSGYGYGWMLRSWHGHRVWEHGGNIDGFNAQVAIMPDQNVGFALLTNVSASPLGSIAMETIWSELVGKPTPPPTQAQAAPTASPADPTPEAGRYRLTQPSLEILVRLKEGKLTLQPAGQSEVPLVNVGGRRYRVGPPAPEGVFVTFRTSNSGTTELVLEQGGGTFVGPRVQDQAPARPPIEVETLMARMADAVGGEANLRKHRSVRLRYDVDFENQGMKGAMERLQQAPNRAVDLIELRAAGKKVGVLREWFDGREGGSESSFGGSQKKSGKSLADAAAGADFYPELNWKTLYKTITVKGVTKVGDEEAYEVVKQPENGSPITEFVSTKTFLVLRRDSEAALGPGMPAVKSVETYRDYRDVDGVKIPFEITRVAPGMGSVVLTGKEVRFDVKIPETRFRGR